MYEVRVQAVITGEPAIVWAVVSDVAGWPRWDPHEEAARIDGPFATGTTGWSKPHGAPGASWTLTDVEGPHRWASSCALPGGGLRGLNTFEQVGPTRVRCTKTVQVTGPLVPLFRAWFGPRMRRDMVRTLAALEQEAARRSAPEVS